MAPSIGSVFLLAFIIVALNSVTAQSALKSSTGTVNQDQDPSDNCSFPIVTGPCRASFTRFGFRPKQNKCVRFKYGGCRGNGNNFLTRRECNQKCLEETDVCKLPVATSKCGASKQRYAFNPDSGKCELFVYGGCGNNGNNFVTLAACRQQCAPSTDVCKLPAVGGRCRGYFTRYAYNPSTLQCESFVYGGCGSNGNNFMTLAECEERCSPATINN